MEAVLWEAYEVRLGRGGRIRATQAIVGDDTGNIRVIWWGNPWIAQQLKAAIARTAHTPSSVPRIVLSGKVSIFQGKKQMESPEWELVGSANAPGLHTAGLVPFYPSAATTKNRRIPPRKMREIVRDALDSTKNGGGRLGIPDPLPDAVREDAGLLMLGDAVEQAHYPGPRMRRSRRGGGSPSTSSSPSSSGLAWSATIRPARRASSCPSSRRWWSRSSRRCRSS